VSPERDALRSAISALARKIEASVRRELERRMLHVDQLARRLVPPGARLLAQAEILAHLRVRLRGAAARLVVDRQGVHLLARLRAAAHSALERSAARCASLGASLSHLDPARVLERGYSIVQKPDGRIVSDSAALLAGESVGLRFAKGGADARIESTYPPGKPSAS
jgi:exodeoxyribonuclease VII large subunit